MSIFDTKNAVDLYEQAPNEGDKEHKERLGRIEKMSIEEIWGSSKPEIKVDEREPEGDSQLDIILKTFPGSKVVAEEPKQEENSIEKRALLNLLTPEVAASIEKDVLTSQGLSGEPRMDVRSEALRLITIGRSIIPVGLNKRPLIAWQEYQKRFLMKRIIQNRQIAERKYIILRNT